MPSTVSIFVQVDAKYDDRAALHQAAGIGNIPLIKLLLEFGATVDIEVRALRTTIISVPSHTVTLFCFHRMTIVLNLCI